jgi:hypothetical protein
MEDIHIAIIVVAVLLLICAGCLSVSWNSSCLPCGGREGMVSGGTFTFGGDEF